MRIRGEERVRVRRTATARGSARTSSTMSVSACSFPCAISTFSLAEPPRKRSIALVSCSRAELTSRERRSPEWALEWASSARACSPCHSLGVSPR